MTTSVVQLPSGTRGFDTNTVIDEEGARAFYEKGFRFALRYIPRVTAHANDVTVAEILRLLDAGLAFMPVQHVESDSSWIPSRDKGTTYGVNAAAYCAKLGLSPGVCVWLDLEGVDVHVPAETIIAYCNAWHIEVKKAGFHPGIYFGWHDGITGEQIYRRLLFDRYWSAYNADGNQYPIIRGACMRQHAAKPGEAPIGFAIDTDFVSRDALGGLPTALAPAGWTAA